MKVTHCTLPLFQRPHQCGPALPVYIVHIVPASLVYASMVVSQDYLCAAWLGVVFEEGSRVGEFIQVLYETALWTSSHSEYSHVRCLMRFKSFFWCNAIGVAMA